MFLNMHELLSDLQHRYTKLGQDYKQLQDDLREYQLSKIPKYYSIPNWLDDNGITASYDEMKELAELAREKSLRYAKPIRTGSTAIGTLYCFLEELIESAFNEMTDPDEDDEEF